ncbi:hypothetical protein SAMN04515666_108184 [Bosea lupini]|uniref:Uncharacterized protein n=1 Tax=Bosea lupini TaxID=1036779 RepID=A0A1H7WJH7_9HYPH|nr:hypothetical protein [Bosea lupini]SEM21138.1 hypothetical protein SAMN04515666_108184 [Bosea lupini]
MRSTSEIGFGGRAIHNSEDCLAAEARIAELAIAPIGSDEEAERVGLIDAVNAYRLKQDSPATAAMTNPITSLEQYEAATQRVTEFCSCAKGTPAADELEQLIVDIRTWETEREKQRPRYRVAAQIRDA